MFNFRLLYFFVFLQAAPAKAPAGKTPAKTPATPQPAKQGR